MRIASILRRAATAASATMLLALVGAQPAVAGTAVTTSCFDPSMSAGQIGWQTRSTGPFSFDAECPDYRIAMTAPAVLNEQRINYIHLPPTLTGLDVTVSGGPPAWSGVRITMRVCSMDECGEAVSPNADGTPVSKSFTLGDGVPENPVTLVVRATCAVHDLPDPDAEGPLDYLAMYGFVPDCDWQIGHDTIISGLKFNYLDETDPQLSLTDGISQTYEAVTPWLPAEATVYPVVGDVETFVSKFSYQFGDGEVIETECPKLPDESYPFSCFWGSAEAGPITLPSDLTGAVPLHMTATDAAGNSAELTTIVRLDSSPPAPPENLRIDGAIGQWVSSGDLHARWDLPSGIAPTETESGVGRAKWELRDGVGNLLNSGDLEGETLDSLTARVNIPGSYQLRVWLVDAAGNEGEHAVLDFSYDDLAPVEPTIAPIPTINAEVAAGDVQIEWSDPVYWPSTFSGVCGYRHAFNGISAYDPPIGADAVDAPAHSFDLTEEAIAELEDGVKYFHVRAVSCAGVLGRTSHAKVTVDRTPPTVASLPAVGGLLAPGSSLLLKATDPGAWGGIASFNFAIDGGPVQTVAGTTASIPLTQGLHTITFSATDRAGNTSSEKVISAGVDGVAPSAAFDAVDASDPGLIRAKVSDQDSGIADAWIEYSEPGSPTWLRLLGDSAGGAPLQLSARFPDEDTIPEGTYRLRIVARDRAGNVTTVSTRVGGADALITLPLRSRPAIRLSLAPSPTAQVSNALLVGFGQGVEARGSLRDASGAPVANAAIAISESVGSQPKRLISTVRTDSVGLFVAPVPAGPSRAIEARFAGNPTIGPASASATFSVRGRVTLRKPPMRVASGKRFYLRGVVDPGLASLPRGGARIELQHRAGKRWSGEVVNARTLSNGAFAFARRFHARGKALRFTFRVAVTPEAGWPYATGYSEIRKVVVR